MFLRASTTPQWIGRVKRQRRSMKLKHEVGFHYSWEGLVFTCALYVNHSSTVPKLMSLFDDVSPEFAKDAVQNIFIVFWPVLTRLLPPGSFLVIGPEYSALSKSEFKPVFRLSTSFRSVPT